ncbi:MAG: hypothetical protein ACW99U_01630 [Candidatus Thorarchaeota archaeon]
MYEFQHIKPIHAQQEEHSLVDIGSILAIVFFLVPFGLMAGLFFDETELSLLDPFWSVDFV